MHIEIVGNWYRLTIHTLRICMTLNFADKIGDYNILQQNGTSTMLNIYYVCINILVLCYLLQIFFNYWYCLPVPYPASTKNRYIEYSTYRYLYDWKRVWVLCLFMNSYLNQFITGIVSFICLITFDYRYSNSKLILPCFKYISI